MSQLLDIDAKRRSAIYSRQRQVWARCGNRRRENRRRQSGFEPTLDETRNASSPWRQVQTVNGHLTMA